MALPPRKRLSILFVGCKWWPSNSKHKKRNREITGIKKIKARIEQQKREQAELRAVIKCETERVRELQEKLKEEQSRGEKLRKEVQLLSQQRSDTQARLHLCFQILKAREKHDVRGAVVQALRETRRKANYRWLPIQLTNGRQGLN